MSDTSTLDYFENASFRLPEPFSLRRGTQVIAHGANLVIQPGYDRETACLAGMSIISALCDGKRSHFGRKVELQFGLDFPDRFGGGLALPFLLPTGNETTLDLDIEVNLAEMDGFQTVHFAISGDCMPGGRQHFTMLLPARWNAFRRVAA